jgi:hypothetical protein
MYVFLLQDKDDLEATLPPAEVSGEILEEAVVEVKLCEADQLGKKGEGWGVREGEGG